jgi:putative chitinase
MIKVMMTQIKKLAPNIKPDYEQAFHSADAVLAQFGISDNKLRMAHFMAQILHESGAFTILEENLNYSAKRMTQVWPKRFPTVAAAQPFEHDPQKLANKVYGGRMGNVDPDDGWKYRGRGLLQLTGRESYIKHGSQVGADLEGQPDLVATSGLALKIAAAEFKASGCNAFADADNLEKVTKAINGGLIGLDERKAWLVKTKKIWA